MSTVDRPASRAAWAIVALFALVALPLWLMEPHQDVATYLVFARAILSGQRPYIELWDANPPLIMWLSIPPVWLGDHFRISTAGLFQSFVLATTALSLWLSAKSTPAASSSGARAACCS